MKRVVITGLGVVSCIGNDIHTFAHNLRYGKSGISLMPEMGARNFRCHVGGVPDRDVFETALHLFGPEELMEMEEINRYACVAAAQASEDAGFPVTHIREMDSPYHEAGVILGSGNVLHPEIEKRSVIDEGKVKKLGSRFNAITLLSGPSSRIAKFCGLGNRVEQMNTTSCSGLTSIVNAYRHIRDGYAERMFCGGVEGSGPYVWGPLDSMRVLADNFNDRPKEASRPMSEKACGFVPSAGAGILHLESLSSAEERGVKIYAEIDGAFTNCGAQYEEGSQTAPNFRSIVNCIQGAIFSCDNITRDSIDLINGHLTGTFADPFEVKAWKEALDGAWPHARDGYGFPFIHSTKSIVGHMLIAAGGIETVACCLMLRNGFVHPSINCEDLHPELEPFRQCIVQTGQSVPKLRKIIKANFGFGDINSCIVLRRR